MLYFSKLRIFFVIIISFIFILFATSNFSKFVNDKLDKKINLGLDLQGGSYLLLEIDNNPVIIKTLQSKIIDIKSFFKDQSIIIKNIKINLIYSKIFFELFSYRFN